jgi:CheY-like chemotaxis protein
MMPAILVVDDEAGMRDVLTRQLSARGHVTLAARTAEEALDRIAIEPEIHVVVADLQMPGHGGAWLVDQLAQKFPDVAVILATADDAVAGMLSLKASVVGYLLKPVSGDQLAAAVTAGLQWHEHHALPSREGRPGDTFDAWLDKKPTRSYDDDSGSGN